MRRAGDGAQPSPRSWSANVRAVPEEKTGKERRDKRDPAAKDAALRRLHAASDEVLAVFEHNLRDNAKAAGASEEEIRDAQAEHPEHS